eukprot:136508_1
MATKQKQTKRCIQNSLSQIGFNKQQIDKALYIYEENYPIYDTNIINEIIYQLTRDKDSICQKFNKKKFNSRTEVAQTLQNMNLHKYYIEIALKQYEMATVNDPDYDIDSIVDIIMELRAIDCCQNTSDNENISPNNNNINNLKVETQNNLSEQQITLANELVAKSVKTPEGRNEESVLEAFEAVNAANKQNKMANHNATQIENIEHEIVTTERNYCAGLNILLNELILPIFENKYVNTKYKSTMVSSIPSLLQFHNGFLTELNTAFNSKHHSIANTFNKYILQNKSEFVNIYLKFVRDYNSILDLLGTTLHGNKLLDQFIKRMRKEKKSLLSYLILPIQRIPRYILLLRDLKRCDANYDHIECALEMITEIAETFNSEQRKIENIADCIKIQSSLHGLKYSIVDPSNNRKFEGKFKFIEKHSHHQREFYVFNDIVIITNSKKKCKYILDIRTMDIKRDKSNGLNHKSFIQFKLITGCTKPMFFISQSIENVNKLNHILEVNRYEILAQDVLELNGSVGSLKSQLARQLACIL